MELETEAFLVQKCRSLVEQQLGWGDSEEWSSQDFETLSARILEKTHVQLSVITLKRIWGKIRYESRPTVTTLNALAQFVGFENWRSFKQHESSLNGHGSHRTETEPLQEQPGAQPSKKNRKKVVYSLLAGAVLAAALLYYAASPPPATDETRYQFSSKKVVDTGVPNTVIFDYDATSAAPTDSIFIQQSWDPRLSRQVARDQRQHTSIYYYPGFFQAKLRVNNQVVKEHPLLIKSEGWLILAEQPHVPVYFKKEDALGSGSLGLSREQIEAKNITLQPETPWIGYYHVGDLPEVYTNNFVFEAEVKNEYSEGSAVCQHTEVHILFEGATLIVPLSIPGCVSELKFLDLDGKKADLSAFGVDFSNWAKVRAEVRDTVGRVFVNGRKADEFTIRMKPAKLAGMIFKFKGTGRVDHIRIAAQDGEALYEEEF